MRISTNTLYQNGTTQITNLQSDVAKLQQEISSGKRIQSPSDDPVAASAALEVSFNQSVNSKFADNRTAATNKLNGLDTTLSSISDIMTAAQSSLVSAGNGTLSDTDRASIATTLSQSLQQLIGIANSKDAYGNYQFSGFKTQTQPFTATASGATYNGDSNEQSIQVDSNTQITVSAAGNNVFQANGNDIFSTLTNVINLLNTPATTAAAKTALTSGLATASTNLKTSVDNILTIRSAVGSKLNEIDSLNSAGSSRDLQYTTTLSNLQDTDLVKAASDLSKQNTILQAAQQSFVKTTSLSLFQYIN